MASECPHRGRGACQQCRLHELYENEYARKKEQRESEEGA